MKVVLLAVGSRGDIEPMISLGKALQGTGKPVTVVALRDAAPQVEAAGLSFVPIDWDTSDMSDVEAEAVAHKVAGGGRSFVRAVSAWLADIAPQVTAAEMAAVEPGDLVVAGVMSLDDAMALQEARGCTVATALLAPMLPTASGLSTPFAPRPQATSMLNRWAGRAAVAACASMCTTTGSHLRDQLNLPRTSARGFARLLQTVPTLLATSPLVTPPPGDWPGNICQTGIWFDDGPTWDPPADLTEFLAAGEPPVFLGFGSMPSPDSTAEVRLMMQAARRAGCRAVIRLPYLSVDPGDPPPDVYLLREAPYRWLFPQMAAIIHHGGAGTTAEALLSGVPNAVVAFGGDQPYYGRRVHDLGAGPAPIRRSKLNSDRLTELITDLTEPAQAAQWRAGATEASSHLLQERGLEVAVERLTALMTEGEPLAHNSGTAR